MIEMFCSMHVGVNLCAAKVKGPRLKIGKASVRIDMVVHSACKLLGCLGNPEYGKGVHGFPEYLHTLLEEAESLNDDLSRPARLERLVGRRYFVTSRNAGRLLFMAPHAVTFLQTVK